MLHIILESIQDVALILIFFIAIFVYAAITGEINFKKIFRKNNE